MLTNEQIQEREPSLLQQHLLEINNMLEELQEKLPTQIENYYKAKTEIEMVKSQIQYLNGQRRSVQSILKSLQ